MATNKIAYASVATLTISLASKTSGQGRRSAAVDNSSTLAVDWLGMIAFLVGTITSPANGFVFGNASADEGTTYELGGSSDADYNTLRGDEVLLKTIAATANTTTYNGCWTIAQWYGGRLARNIGIGFSQTNCGTLSATGGNHFAKYLAITYTVA